MAHPCENSRVQTFTADEFRQSELQHRQCDDKRLNETVPLIKQMLYPQSIFSDHVTLSGFTYCERSMERLGERISLQLPDRKVVAKVNGLRWVMQNNQVELDGKEATYLFNPQLKQSITLQSSIRPTHLDYPTPYWDLIKYFRDVINTAAEYPQVDLNNIQFQFSILNCKKDDIDTAIKIMEGKGFLVELSEPYLLMEKEETLFTKQDIVVKVPQDASIPHDATLEDHNSYKEELSLHNLLVRRRRALEKTASSTTYVDGTSETVKQREKLTLDDILGQLQKVAKNTPLARRYAFDVSSLTADEQKCLIEELNTLNYSVSLDLPSFKQIFVGIYNGFYRHCLPHLMFVSLPEQTTDRIN